jgi:flavin reductase (DIM6/NTAB) family NADH-FMN oxidoreductase RutF
MLKNNPEETHIDLSEELRRVMRHWTTGVTIVSSSYNGAVHGMTVNSFTSISLEPPVVSITLANTTRTLQMVLDSKVFGVSILREDQADISDRFAGKIKDEVDRYEGIDTFTLINDAPLISNSCGYLNCKVIFTHPLPNSTLILGEVIAADPGKDAPPLIYLNREYHKVK